VHTLLSAGLVEVLKKKETWLPLKLSWLLGATGLEDIQKTYI